MEREGTTVIHLVTDSTAYLPPEIKEKYNIHTISLKVIVGDQTYDEEGGITRDEFYRLLANVATTPTTSQPSAGEFVDLYSSLVRDPEDEVISIHISEGISGTVPNALAAAHQVAPDQISVVDSRTSAIGLFVIVLSAGEAIAAGKTRPEVLAIVDRLVRESCSVFMVEDLAYLHKGGRINTASRFLGTLLSIKPILHMENGKIEALDKTRTSARARQRVLDEVQERVGNQLVRACVAHIQAREAAEELATRARERLNCLSLHISEVGPVIGAHVGPGFVGLAAGPVGEEGY
jgi:DegV family protein with EDD domain